MYAELSEMNKTKRTTVITSSRGEIGKSLS